MNNKTVTGILLGTITTLVLACNTKPVVIDEEQIKKEIQAKEDEFAAQYNKGEMKDIGYYAEDANSFFQNRPPLIGKQAIVDYLKSSVMSRSDSISFTTKEIFVSKDGEHVLEIGYFKVVDSAKTINSGNYMSLFEKRNGKYVCLRDMSTSDTPAE